ncbi:MAG: zinc transporter ZupT [Candidatus Diapherotrites archaeon CG10_big_fil_rev_8_21_14_0_10_31_34]|nr:MAG: zinc transporter ZupT [Candidatus Diapherotrites archaeon CG10_big_fil_rev_8_21_14_0_10_31_34]
MNVILTGLILALFAGLSTTIGSAVVFFIKEMKTSYLAFSLAFSTGVMITISFIEMLPKGIEAIGYEKAIIMFFGGAGIIFLVDYFIPHEYILEKVSNVKKQDAKLLKTGLFVGLGLAIHNFPEGFAVFAGNLHSAETGIIMAIAIAIHNIPEGIAVSIPVYFATKKKRKAFFVSFLSGMAEPLGAIIAALILLPFLSDSVIGASLAFVAGIMVFICFDELLPTAKKYCNGNSHLMIFGLLIGSLVMGATLVILN